MESAADSAREQAHTSPRLELRKAASVLTFHAVGRLVHEAASKLITCAVDSVRLRGRQVSLSCFGPTCLARGHLAHGRLATSEATSNARPKSRIGLNWQHGEVLFVIGAFPIIDRSPDCSLNGLQVWSGHHVFRSLVLHSSRSSSRSQHVALHAVDFLMSRTTRGSQRS